MNIPVVKISTKLSIYSRPSIIHKAWDQDLSLRKRKYYVDKKVQTVQSNLVLPVKLDSI